MKYCVYNDGTTLELPTGAACPNLSQTNGAPLVDQFDVDTAVEVSTSTFWTNVGVALLFLLPTILTKLKKGSSNAV